MNAGTWIEVGVAACTFLVAVATGWLGFQTKGLGDQTRRLGNQNAKALMRARRALVVLEEPEHLLHPDFTRSVGGQGIQCVGGFPGMFCEGREEATGRTLFSIVANLVNHGTGPALNLTVYLVYNNRNGEKAWQPIPGIDIQIVGAKSHRDTCLYLNAFETNEMPKLLGYGLTYQNLAYVTYWTEALVNPRDVSGRIQKVKFGKDGPKDKKASQREASEVCFYQGGKRESAVLRKFTSKCNRSDKVM